MKRDTTIDIMKCIGIFLVILGHTFHDSGIIYLFHMPMFFILSGAVMGYSTHNFSIRRRFKYIMVPYFVFSILSYAYWFLIESRFRTVEETSIFTPPLGNVRYKISTIY